jgi:hypothetical protein
MTPEAPQFETRVRIIQQFGVDEGCQISDDTARAIAIIVASIREPEGAAVRLILIALLADQDESDLVDPDGGFDEVEALDQFGWCPECGKADGFLNIERDHFAYCDAHRTRWFVGANLFSGWRHENEATWDRNRQHIEHYRDVCSHTPTAAMLERGFSQ